MRYVKLIGIALLWSGVMLSAANNAAQNAPKEVRAPRVVKRVAPDYPDELRRQRVSGSVVIAGTVPKAGGVLRNPRVVSSTDTRLERYALEAVAKWIWAPGMQNGRAVDVDFQTTVSFSLK